MRKQSVSVYLPDELLAEVTQEGARLERSPSWLLERAWRIARDELRAMSSTSNTPEKEGSPC